MGRKKLTDRVAVETRRRSYRKAKVKCYLTVGWSLEKIKEHVSWSNKVVHELADEIISEDIKLVAKKVNRPLETLQKTKTEISLNLGHKNEPNYPDEKEMILFNKVYYYADLSPDEKEIYNDPERTKEILEDGKTVTTVGDCETIELNIENKDPKVKLVTFREVEKKENPEVDKEEVDLYQKAIKEGRRFDAMRLQFYETTATIDKPKNNE